MKNMPSRSYCRNNEELTEGLKDIMYVFLMCIGSILVKQIKYFYISGVTLICQ